MTVLLTLHAAAKLTSSGSTVRSTLPSWTTSGALAVDMGILPPAMTLITWLRQTGRGGGHKRAIATHADKGMGGVAALWGLAGCIASRDQCFPLKAAAKIAF